MNPKSALLVCFAIAAACESAVAATATASMSVSVTVQAGCLAAVNPTSGEAYLDKASSASTAVSVTCSTSIPYSISTVQAEPSRNSHLVQEMSGRSAAASAAPQPKGLAFQLPQSTYMSEASPGQSALFKYLPSESSTDSIRIEVMY